MAYKFFTQKLLSENALDLNQVFPEKQNDAREANNVAYTLYDIVLFLKDRTEDFKFADAQYVDLDNAISEIVNKYYKSKSLPNPFLVNMDEDEEIKKFRGEVPREAAIVEEGAIKGKGVAKPAKNKVVEVKEIESIAMAEPVKSDMSKVDKFRDELLKRKEIYDDVYDDEEKKDFRELMEKKLETDEFIAEDGDEYFVQRVNILKDFIKTLK
jgi:hypothetical protein